MKDKKDVTSNSKVVKYATAIDKSFKKMRNLLPFVLSEIQAHGATYSEESLTDLMTCAKAMWSNCENLRTYAKVKESKTDDAWYTENSFIMSSADIQVLEERDGYRIILPVRIPHKKTVRLIPDYADSYRMPIYNALMREFPNRRPVFKDKCRILIYHHFENDKLLTDYDNFDYSHLLNCIASFFLIDDSPKYYTLTIDGVVDGKRYTEIRLKKRKQI